MMALKRLALLLIGTQAVLALWSGFRAIEQVLSLELNAAPVLSEGSLISTRVTSSGRAYVTLQLDVLQGDRVRSLHTHVVDTHRDPAMDPRLIHDSVGVRLSRADIAGLSAGDAVLRLTATGRAQWLRLPPPSVRQVAVRIDESSAANR